MVVTLNFLGALIVGLIPSAIARFLLVRKPLRNRSANLIAGLSILPALLAYQALSEISETTFVAIVGLVALATFIVGKAILHRNYNDHLAAKIKERLNDPNLSDEERGKLETGLRNLKQ